ncbi:MAG: EVE domain-containing protein [Amaricoccus sp.]
MNHWLFKSEAETWSWDDQVARGDAGREWDGVRNFQDPQPHEGDADGRPRLLLPLRRHQGRPSASSRSSPRPTPFRPPPALCQCVDLRAVAPLPNPVTLETIQVRPALRRHGLELPPRSSR